MPASHIDYYFLLSAGLILMATVGASCGVCRRVLSRPSRPTAAGVLHRSLGQACCRFWAPSGASLAAACVGTRLPLLPSARRLRRGRRQFRFVVRAVLLVAVIAL